MMKLLDVAMVKRAASPRHRKADLRHDPWEVLALVLRLFAVGLLAWDGWAFLHLWQDGYRHIPAVGPLFLAGAVSALAVAAGLLLRPSRLLGLAGAGVVLGILAGLAVSVNFGSLLLCGWSRQEPCPGTPLRQPRLAYSLVGT
jgi:hypothetical protein